MKNKTKKSRIISVRLSEAELALIQMVMNQYGVVVGEEMSRHALLKLAMRFGIHEIQSQLHEQHMHADYV